MADDINTQLTKYVTDAHAIEEQALAQLRTAPDIAGDPEISRVFREHLKETEDQERLVPERIEARGATPSRVKDAVMAVGGKGFVLFARSQPDTPGKLVTHAFSYEHMELAAYDLLEQFAERAGDGATAEVAKRIRADEDAMAARLAGSWDRAVDASLKGKDVSEALDSYLADAHALEAQAIQLLERGKDTEGLRELFTEHLAESKRHAERIDERLEGRGSSASRLKDAALAAGALNWGAFFKSQPDTPAKLAMFAYAFEHLEIGGYEQLLRVAQRAADYTTAETAETILAEERAAAEKIYAAFPEALGAVLS